MKNMRAALLGLAFVTAFVLAGVQARAQEMAGNEDISSIFCPALSDNKSYDGRFESYRRLIQGQDGWIFRTSSDFQKKLSINEETMRSIATVQRILKEKGIEFVMLYVPTRGMLHHASISPDDQDLYDFTDVAAVWENYENTVREMRNEGINVVSIPRPEAGTPFFYKRDHHWNAYGARRAALAVAQYVKGLPVYGQLTKVPFRTVKKGPYDFFGTSDKVFEKVCNTQQPPERIDIYATERSDNANAAGDLFGETSEPEVVLMGTSNSTWEPSFSNFEGFLKEELSADILNMAVSGGGVDTGMLNYLNSDHKKAGKAKLIIWEVPGYYALDRQASLFRQAIPGIYGDCGQDALASSAATVVDDDDISVLDDMKDKEITGSEYYLYLSFSKPLTKPLKVYLRYPRDKDRVKVGRSPLFVGNTQVYLALKDGKKKLDEVFVDIDPQDRKDLKVDAKICKMP